MKSAILLSNTIKEISFKNNIVLNPEEKKNYDIQIHFEYNVDFVSDNSHAVAHFKELIESKTDPNLLFLSVSCDGVLEVDSIESDDDKKRLHIQGYHLLFPVVATTVNHILVSSGLPPIVVVQKEMPEDSIIIK